MVSTWTPTPLTLPRIQADGETTPVSPLGLGPISTLLSQVSILDSCFVVLGAHAGSVIIDNIGKQPLLVPQLRLHSYSPPTQRELESTADIRASSSSLTLYLVQLLPIPPQHQPSSSTLHHPPPVPLNDVPGPYLETPTEVN